VTARQLSRQQLDPQGTLGASIPSMILVAVSFAWGLFATVGFMAEGDSVVLSVVSLVLLGGACALIIRAIRSARGAVTASGHLVAHILVLVAFAVSALGAPAASVPDRTGWGPFSLGLIMIALAPYRPVRELIIVGAASAGMTGVITLVAASRSLGSPAAAIVIAISIAPVVVALACAVGSAIYSRGIIEVLLRGRRRAEARTESLAGELRDDIVRSVQLDRVTILRRDVVPFFAEVLSRGRISDSDRDRALTIAGAIRDLMVAEADRSWLESVMRQAGGAERVHGTVDDPEHLAAHIQSSQRTAMRAAIIALAEDPEVAGPLSVALSRNGGRYEGVLTVGVDAPEHVMRSKFGRYFAVMRTAFPVSDVRFEHSRLTLRFHYEHS
jgi:hypothetical protein